jgi:phosphoglycolate phosphatase-like HAD superfamily hydrolase
MEKPIIATTLSGLFIKKEAWDKAHTVWYENAAKKLNDKSILKWIGRQDYFKGVDEIMQKLYPNLNEPQKTIKARQIFFDSVIKYIQQNPKIRNTQIIDYFYSLKSEYRLALITTNTKQVLEKILSVTKLSDLFNIIEYSKESEKDNKIIVFDRFIKKYKNPVIYIGGSRKDSFDYCKDKSIKGLFANFEGEEEIKGIESVHNLKELKQKIKSI